MIMCYSYPPDQEYYKNPFNSEMIIQCEIIKAKDYTFCFTCETNIYQQIIKMHIQSLYSKLTKCITTTQLQPKPVTYLSKKQFAEYFLGSVIESCDPTLIAWFSFFLFYLPHCPLSLTLSFSLFILGRCVISKMIKLPLKQGKIRLWSNKSCYFSPV